MTPRYTTVGVLLPKGIKLFSRPESPKWQVRICPPCCRSSGPCQGRGRDLWTLDLQGKFMSKKWEKAKETSLRPGVVPQEY